MYLMRPIRYSNNTPPGIDRSKKLIMTLLPSFSLSIDSVQVVELSQSSVIIEIFKYWILNYPETVKHPHINGNV